MKYFTGVGSRDTPQSVRLVMAGIGCDFAKAGWTLRSGAADGADSAWEAGWTLAGLGNTEIYLPWPKFNGHSSPLHLNHGDMHGKAAAIARTVHPRWSGLGPQVQKLHVRNVHQVLGPNLESPSQLVACWTEDGCETKADRTADTGGTGTAIELADNLGIPVFNIRRKASLKKLLDVLAIC